MSVFISLIPYNIIIIFIRARNKNVINIFPTYALSLKNYTDVDNNIVYAMSEATIPENIKIPIMRFNTSVNKGVNVYSAFEQLKKEINLKNVSQFITLLQNCYLNGGNFSEILQKYAHFESKQNLEKEKQDEKLLTSKLTLFILIVLSIALLFGFVLNNPEYKAIILNTTGGQIVLILNILTYLIMYFIYLKLCKMEE